MIKIPNRSSFVEIDLAAFRWNFKQIQKRVSPAKICAVVKAEAYGHGAVRIARESEKLGADSLCTAFVQSGLELVEAGIKTPILVLIPPEKHEIRPALENGLILTVYSYDIAREISKAAVKLKKKALIHVNIDTGMHQGGLLWPDAVSVLNKISKLPNIRMDGLFTHFAASDWSDLTYSYKQLKRFKDVIRELPFDVPRLHTANTGAILQIKESHLSMVRPGISLYGYYPSTQCARPVLLQPVMTFKSYVGHIQEHDAKESFGYSLTHTINEKSKIAFIPVGYADGVNRLLSNIGRALIREQYFPVIGRVAMDSILVEIGSNSKIHKGDEVVLFGKQGKAEIPIYEWCEKLGTIPYEITCNISGRVPRVYINGEK